MRKERSDKTSLRNRDMQSIIRRCPTHEPLSSQTVSKKRDAAVRAVTYGCTITTWLRRGPAWVGKKEMTMSGTPWKRRWRGTKVFADPGSRACQTTACMRHPRRLANKTTEISKSIVGRPLILFTSMEAHRERSNHVLILVSGRVLLC